MTYVEGADRMVTAARLTPGGLNVRFADQREGLILFEDLKLSGEPDHVTIPEPYVIQVHLIDGTVEEVPWDFARHFTDPGYRARSEAAGEGGRRLFGEQLRLFRSQRGLTQEELAARAGVNRVTIARFEAGERLPRHQTLVALADALELPVGRLITG
jgi:DNA-binding XRE family transcriptional regulator